MSMALLGIGTAVPTHSISQAAAGELAQGISHLPADERRTVVALYRRAGVERRHSVVLEHSGDLTEGSPLQTFYPPAATTDDYGPTVAVRMQKYESTALSLAQRAAEVALHAADLPPSAISHLVTVSCTGFSAPGYDIGLIQGLGLPVNVARTQIGFMGCHGLLNGLRVAHAFTQAQPEARVLVTALELCSIHQQYGSLPDHIVSNALFADGAAAIVCEGERAGAARRAAPWRLTSSFSQVVPETTHMMTWKIRDHGFEMTLSAEVPHIIQQYLRPALTEWLSRFDLQITDIAQWAIHPGGPRILSACLEALELAPEQLQPSRDVLARFGNMSSPTVAFILQSLQTRENRTPCVLLGFGPGLTIEAALLR